jgi:hypothetical protein
MNILFPSTPRSHKLFFPLLVFQLTLSMYFSFHICMLDDSSFSFRFILLPCLYLLKETNMEFHITQFCVLLLSLLVWIIRLTTFPTEMLNLNSRSSLKVWYQVSHPWKYYSVWYAVPYSTRFKSKCFGYITEQNSILYKKTNLLGRSTQANYTNWATATSRRS